MKAVLCTRWGGPDELIVDSVESPSLRSGEVRIAVRAAGVNFADILMVAGKYQVRPPLPFSPGVEAAGEVLEVAAGVERVKPGDRVVATRGWGAFAEQTVVPEITVFPIPEAVAFETAAAMPVAYGTAYYALVDRANLAAGEVLMIHGAAGGVGLAALQLGKRLGARVIGTVGSPEKARFIEGQGADHVINYRSESIRDRVKELTEGRGADVIFDNVGGDAFDQSMRCIAWKGRLLVIGFASGRIPELRLNLALLKGCQIVGVNWPGFVDREPETYRRHVTQLLDWCAGGTLSPHIAMARPLREVSEALNALIARKVTGKIVLTIP